MRTPLRTDDNELAFPRADGDPVAVEIVTEVQRKEVLLKAGALQSAIFNSANF